MDGVLCKEMGKWYVYHLVDESNKCTSKLLEVHPMDKIKLTDENNGNGVFFECVTISVATDDLTFTNQKVALLKK